MAPSEITQDAKRTIIKTLAPYKKPVVHKSVFQVINTLVPFVLLWYLMLRSLEHSYWLTLLLALPTAGLLVRAFIIQHDCGHGSFFKSRAAGDAVGFLMGVLTLTPYKYWRKMHAIHHATSGDLDRRKVGDIYTLTVDEYLALPRAKRLAYRLYRNPFILFVFGPTVLFVLKHRLPLDLPRTSKREWASIGWTNLAIAGVVAVMWATIGLKRFLLVQAPVTLISGTAGIWLFYVQHQFKVAYWEPHSRWDYFDAALQGCSFYDLPGVFRWFTGNIGYHHIHHLCALIPNYQLKPCYEQVPELQRATRLTFWQSLECASLKLWDPDKRRLVGFRQLASVPAAG